MFDSFSWPLFILLMIGANVLAVFMFILVHFISTPKVQFYEDIRVCKNNIKRGFVGASKFVFFDHISFIFCIWLPATTLLAFFIGSKESANAFMSGAHYIVILVDGFSMAGLVVFFAHTLRKILTFPVQTLLISMFVIPVNFAYLYLRIENNSEVGCITNSEWFGDTLYFSYTTFTTLGYGDFAPLGICKYLTSIEALLGLMTVGAIPGVLIALLLTRERTSTLPKANRSESL